LSADERRERVLARICAVRITTDLTDEKDFATVPLRARMVLDVLHDRVLRGKRGRVEAITDLQIADVAGNEVANRYPPSANPAIAVTIGKRFTSAMTGASTLLLSTTACSFS
jgi:hypothetical protein